MRFRASAVMVPVLAAAALSGGCGDRPPTVSGNVTMDNTPVADGLITFVSSDGATGPVVVKIKDGKYSTSLSTGSFKVQISAPKPTGQKRPTLPGSPDIDILAESIPERYNAKTELKTDVKPGDNKIDWPLKST